MAIKSVTYPFYQNFRLQIIGLDKNKIQDFTPLQGFDELKSLNTNFNPVDLDYCPPKGKGPKQLHKYCKRMRKNAGLDEGIEFKILLIRMKHKENSNK